MTIEVQCDECFQSYQVRDERAGQTLKCKGCGSRMRVPATDEEPEDLSEHYGEPIAPARKKQKPTKAKKKSASKKSAGIPIRKLVKKLFGCLSIALGGLMLVGAVYMFFAGDGPDGKKSRPVAGLVMAGAFLSVGTKWLTDE
tara:strand:+ start:81280 stop:81705 length:426 start_codon:yes stop_codon:yes gene_type:complete